MLRVYNRPLALQCDRPIMVMMKADLDIWSWIEHRADRQLTRGRGYNVRVDSKVNSPSFQKPF
jgi:hypothetical protein